MHVRFSWIILLATCFSPAANAVDAVATAASGQPYGVATIEIPVAGTMIGQTLPPLTVTDQQGRTLYPIARDIRVKVGPASEQPIPPVGRGRLIGRVGNLIRELTNEKQDLEQTVARQVTFLFRGAQPLQVSLTDAGGTIGVYEIVPAPNPIAHRELLSRWWSTYTDAAKRQIDAADYPPWVETYLVAMLSGHIGMPLPQWYLPNQKDDDQVLDTLKLVAGAGETGEAIFRRAAAGDNPSLQQASLPLPPGPNWAPAIANAIPADISVEPIATRVPPECLYIRYGSFENYMWFRDLSNEYGGDISRMVTLRGVDDDGAARIESQLNLKTTALSRMLGPTVIEDQAIIGRDLFLGDGATIGVLFKAKNAFLLRTSLNGDRSKRASEDSAVTLTDLKIADRPATLLRSADNRVRSFLVEDGDYILVTNSQTLARRFLEVGATGQSLAETSAFRFSRQLMPLERNDTIFAYFSPEMLQGLVAPEYLIEMRRRWFAKSDIALVHLARLASAAGGDGPSGIDELVSAGLLPNGFGQRADGSSVITVGDQVIDTRRGSRGTFLPIADATVDSVTREEADWYASIAADYNARVPQLDPIMVGIQRQQIPAAVGIEQVTIHAEIAPWDPTKYGWLAKQLGPPTRVAMKFAPDDIVAVQVHVASQQLGPPTHLFAAIKDSTPPQPEDFEGVLNIYRSLRELPGYLGAWPQPGAIDRLPLGLGRGTPVGPGLSRLIGGLYRYTGDGFSVLSFQPELLQASLPFMGAVEVNDSAQIRARIGNLAGSQLEGWVNGQLYERAAMTSAAGANFLNMLSRQLKVPPGEALTAADEMLGMTLQCPLGGDYRYSPETGHWISTAWRGDSVPAVAPPDYVAPAMNWFRGAQVTVTQYADRLVADAVIDIARGVEP